MEAAEVNAGQPTEARWRAPGRDSCLQQPFERRAPDHRARPFTGGLLPIQGDHAGLGAGTDRLQPDLLDGPQFTAPGGGITEIGTHLNQLAPAATR